MYHMHLVTRRFSTVLLLVSGEQGENFEAGLNTLVFSIIELKIINQLSYFFPHNLAPFFQVY